MPFKIIKEKISLNIYKIYFFDALAYNGILCIISLKATVSSTALGLFISSQALHLHVWNHSQIIFINQHFYKILVSLSVHDCGAVDPRIDLAPRYHGYLISSQIYALCFHQAKCVYLIC